MFKWGMCAWRVFECGVQRGVRTRKGVRRSDGVFRSVLEGVRWLYRMRYLFVLTPPRLYSNGDRPPWWVEYIHVYHMHQSRHEIQVTKQHFVHDHVRRQHVTLFSIRCLIVWHPLFRFLIKNVKLLLFLTLLPCEWLWPHVHLRLRGSGKVRREGFGVG